MEGHSRAGRVAVVVFQLPRVLRSPRARVPGSWLAASWEKRASCSELALLQPVNVKGELEGRPQLQAHVLHHHVTAQQEQGLAIDFMFSEEVSMGSKLRIGFADKLHHILHCP